MSVDYTTIQERYRGKDIGEPRDGFLSICHVHDEIRAELTRTTPGIARLMYLTDVATWMAQSMDDALHDYRMGRKT